MLKKIKNKKQHIRIKDKEQINQNVSKIYRQKGSEKDVFQNLYQRTSLFFFHQKLL